MCSQPAGAAGMDTVCSRQRCSRCSWDQGCAVQGCRARTTSKMVFSSAPTRGALCTAAWSDTHLCSHTAGLCTCEARTGDVKGALPAPVLPVLLSHCLQCS